VNLDSLNTQELGTLLGLSVRQVWELGNKGLPSTGLGKQKRFVWRECFEWYVRKKVEELTPKRKEPLDGEHYDFDLIVQQTRKTQADAARAEIKLARERGEVVAVEEVKQAQIKVNSIIRNRLLGIPTKVSPLVAVNGNVAKVRAVLDAEMREILTQLSQEAI